MVKYGLLATGLKGFLVLQQLRDKPEFVVSYDNKEKSQLDKIEKWCHSNDVTFVRKKDLDESMFRSVDHIFMVGWQYLVKSNLEKCLVLHDSYLPERRGFCPTVSALIDGENYLAASCFRPTEGDGYPDYGIVYAREKQHIEHPMRIEEAFKIIASLYAKIINNFSYEHQHSVDYEKNSSFSVWRDDLDCQIDWSKSASSIVRQVYATGYPYSGSVTTYKNETIKIFDVVEINDINVLNRRNNCGKILRLIDQQPVVVCGSGLLTIKEAKYAGGAQPVKFDSIRKRLGCDTIRSE